MKELTQERLKELLYYDEFTGVFTWIAKTSKHSTVKIGSVAGSIGRDARGKRYISIKIFNKIYKAHRLAFLYKTGEFPGGQGDHIDQDSLNNAWKNLRDVTNRDNCKNQRLAKNNTSKCAGVFWRKDSNKWRAQIGGGRDKIYLGTFSDKEDAIRVRKEAEDRFGYHSNHGRARPL